MATATVTVTGTPDNPIFNFDFPAGEQGPPGGITTPILLNAGQDIDAVTVSGLYRVASTNATTALHSPKDGMGYHLLVIQTSSTVITHMAFPLGGLTVPRGVYTRILSTTFGPWSFSASQRVDQTAGRAIYQWDDLNSREQLVYGDTGIRRVEADFINGWAGAIATLRRVGAVVSLGVYNLNPAARTAITAYALPVGFRPASHGGNITMPTREGSSYTPLNVDGAGNLQPSTTALSAVGAIHLMTFTTADAWPTALPGTASGSIPNT